LRFEQDKDTGIQVIQIVDAESGKLVRQIPPEELLNITKALRDIKGLMVSKES
jgi:flagellar protein FlaG